MQYSLHNKIDSLPAGIYDALLDERLRDILKCHPEVRAVLAKLDPEEQPARYAAFIAKVIEQVLRQEVNSGVRLTLCNRLIDLISDDANRIHFKKCRLCRVKSRC